MHQHRLRPFDGPERIIAGGRGTGKTTMLLLDGIEYLVDNPDDHAMVVVSTLRARGEINEVILAGPSTVWSEIDDSKVHNREAILRRLRIQPATQRTLLDMFKYAWIGFDEMPDHTRGEALEWIREPDVVVAATYGPAQTFHRY